MGISFFIDAFLLIGCGIITVYITVRYLYKKFKFRSWIPLISGIIIFLFWLIGGLLYLNVIDFPFLGTAGKGNHFMWNSGVEIIGLEPLIDTHTPTYTSPFGLLNILAIIIFGLYPLFLYIGIQIGYLLFGRTEKQTGIVGLLK